MRATTCYSKTLRTEFLRGERRDVGLPLHGRARYWSIRVVDTFIKDVAWSYPDPIPENPKIRDLVAFLQERVDLVIDGVRLARPSTPWSAAKGLAQR